MILAVLDGVVLRIGLSFTFGILLDLGFFGFVLGYGLAPYGYAIPSVIYFLFAGWQKRKSISKEI
jgi:Na+-driven multidrug efflux pump